MQPLNIPRFLVPIGLAMLTVLAAAPARAGDVSWSISVGNSRPVPVYVPPSVVYVPPAVVVAPHAPVQVQPRTLYVHPQTVYVQPFVMVGEEHWHHHGSRHHGKARKHWKHHHKRRHDRDF